MTFVRTEAKDMMWRWREIIVGVICLFGGFWLSMTSRGTLAFLAAFIMVAGIALIFVGWQRGRFRRGRDGVGVLRITEGVITYYGPFTGGVLATEMIREVTLNPLPRAGIVWELHGPETDLLRIPADAEGAEMLFDVFAALPGFDTEAMLAALAEPGRVPRTLWARTHTALH